MSSKTVELFSDCYYVTGGRTDLVCTKVVIALLLTERPVMRVFGIPQQTNELMASGVTWRVEQEAGIRLRAARSAGVLTGKNWQPSSVILIVGPSILWQR
jgi:hypothetical protein